MTLPAVDAGHEVGERLYLPTGSRVHRLPPQVKIIAALGLIIVAVATPAAAWPAFLWYGLLILGLAVAARLPLRRLVGRMAVEVPFVIFALILPFVGRPPTTEFLGITLSEAGLLAAWTILAKATIGVATSVVLAATTRAADLVTGLGRLHVPALLVEIASFMLRYVHVIADQWRRMGQARASRGAALSGPRSWSPLARSTGVLFIRSYERGERVHLAMLSRGYAGTMPLLVATVPRPRDWLFAAAVPCLAALGGVAAVLAVRSV